MIETVKKFAEDNFKLDLSKRLNLEPPKKGFDPLQAAMLFNVLNGNNSPKW